MWKKDQDFLVGGVIILLALFLITQMKSLSFMQSIYPRVLAIAMIIAGLGIILRAAKALKRTGKPYGALSLREFVLQALIPGTFVIVMCLLLRKLGFYATTFIVMLGICIIQDLVINKKIPLSLKYTSKILFFSALSTIALYVSFNVLLNLSTPIGVFGF